jgi:hypothetical protein
MSGVSMNTPMTVKIVECHRSAMKKQKEAANAEQAFNSNSIMLTEVIAPHVLHRTRLEKFRALSRSLPPLVNEKCQAANHKNDSNDQHRFRIQYRPYRPFHSRHIEALAILKPVSLRDDDVTKSPSACARHFQARLIKSLRARPHASHSSGCRTAQRAERLFIGMGGIWHHLDLLRASVEDFPAQFFRL